MNKEFPPNKWFRKYVTPGRFSIFMLLFTAFMIFGPMLIPVVYLGMIQNILLYGLMAFIACMIPMFVWMVYWVMKYPPKVEYCKECNRALPIKYED